MPLTGPTPAQRRSGEPPRRRRRWVVWLVAVLLTVGVLAVLGVLALRSVAVDVAVGDCVAQEGAGVRVVGCGDPDAGFRVVGRVEDGAAAESGSLVCAGFPDATAVFRESGSDPTVAGLVLCLAPVS